MENNENKKEEVLETKVDKDVEVVTVAVVGLIGIGAAYLLGQKIGKREGFAIGVVAGSAESGLMFADALKNYHREITKGD